MYNFHKGISLQGKKARDPHAQPNPSPATAQWSAWGSGWTPTLHTYPISALPLLPAFAWGLRWLKPGMGRKVGRKRFPKPFSPNAMWSLLRQPAFLRCFIWGWPWEMLSLQSLYSVSPRWCAQCLVFLQQGGECLKWLKSSTGEPHQSVLGSNTLQNMLLSSVAKAKLTTFNLLYWKLYFFCYTFSLPQNI